MNPILGRVLRFVLGFFPLFAIFLVVYLMFVHYYEPIVVASANLVTRHLDPATYLKTLENGNWGGYVIDPVDGLRRIRTWDPATRQVILLSLVSVPSLILATPAPWRRRFRWLLIATPMIYMGHVLSAVVLTRGQYCLNQDPGNWLCNWTKTFAVTSGQMMAGLLWFGLTWRFWFEGAKSDVARSDRRTDTGARTAVADTNGGETQ